jgi:hypothetical protein
VRRSQTVQLFYYAQLNRIYHCAAHAHVTDNYHAVAGRSELFRAQEFFG